MTAAEIADKLMSSEHADVVRESVAWMVAELMDAEVSAQIGAQHGERAPDIRSTQRNGYRPRQWDTRAGEIELAIPRLRTGSYFPSFLEPRRRAEQALVAVVQEAYVNGVSTRKVDRLVEQLGISGMNKLAQLPQKRAPAGLGWPQDGQSTIELRTSAGRGERTLVEPGGRNGGHTTPPTVHGCRELSTYPDCSSVREG
jgi:mutator family transposase